MRRWGSPAGAEACLPALCFASFARPWPAPRSSPHGTPLPARPPRQPPQHASVPLLKEMLLTLDLARVAGTPADRRAADRLQRRLLHDDMQESGLLPVRGVALA